MVYRLPDVRQPGALPALPMDEFGNHWDDVSAFLALVHLEEEPTEKYTTQEVEAITKQARDLAELPPSTIPEYGSSWSLKYHLSRLNRKLLLWKVFQINDFPPEILANIFRFVAWSARKPSDVINYRLYLTWVCRHWRFIAIGDPTIWNVVLFRGFSQVERALAWLERSQQTTIDVSIIDPLSGREAARRARSRDIVALGRFMDRLMPKLSHIRSIVVDVVWLLTKVVLERFWKVIRYGCVPLSLQHFEIHRLGELFGWPTDGHVLAANTLPRPFLLGGSAPALKHVCLDGVFIDWAQSSFVNLTVLEIRNTDPEWTPTLDRFGEILRNCPDLRKLTINGGMLSATDSTTFEPVELSKLEVLSLANFALQRILSLIAQCTAPHLRSLSVARMPDDDAVPLFSFLAESNRFPKVQHLALDTVHLERNDESEEIMARWLLSMPDLRYLKTRLRTATIFVALVIDPSRIGISFGLQATYSAGQVLIHSICPKLDVIEWQGPDFEPLVIFARLRRRWGVPFRKIYLQQSELNGLAKREAESLQEISELWVVSEGEITTELFELGIHKEDFSDLVAAGVKRRLAA